ncbi:hypothetical protein [Devosia sp. CN2-171]|uniref:hypothetical protein n=1 Tax=Devosia sp. CN2-171 TaxID=3400909 RepID=UPI003BF8B273
MKQRAKSDATNQLQNCWPLSYAATMGSSVRSKGVFLEVRARLPNSAKKALSVRSRELTLVMPEERGREFEEASAIVAKVLEGVEKKPVLPREVEDILSIKSTERHRWLKDGRLPSAGTRTVKLRGRARKVTFHVFDPRVVEDILDRALIEQWREDDAKAARENRRRAAWKAQVTRAEKADTAGTPPPEGQDEEDRFKLLGWAEFERDGLLR